MAKFKKYHASGFYPLGEPPARRKMLAAVVDIAKGDALHDDTNGVATNATTALAATFLGIAAAPCDNSPTASLSVEYFPFDKNTQYVVPVADSLISTTNIGTLINLSAVGTVAHATNPTEGIAFFVDDIDVSAAAIVGNTYGYAIGHFVVVGTQASSA
jgi:hypothetical protein